MKKVLIFCKIGNSRKSVLLSALFRESTKFLCCFLFVLCVWNKTDQEYLFKEKQKKEATLKDMALTYFFIYIFIFKCWWFFCLLLWDCICTFIKWSWLNGLGWSKRAVLLFITQNILVGSFLSIFSYSFSALIFGSSNIFFGIFTPFYYLFIICFTFFFTFASARDHQECE